MPIDWLIDDFFPEDLLIFLLEEWRLEFLPDVCLWKSLGVYKEKEVF